MFIILSKPVFVKQSPIFSTYSNDILGIDANIEIFGKSVNKIFEDLSNKKGLLDSIFTNVITDDDILAIQEYTARLSEGYSPAKAWKDTMTDCSWAAQKATASCGTTIESLKAITATTTTATVATKATAFAFQALSVVGNMIAFALIAQGISLVVKGLDNLLHAAEKCRERVDELMGSYKSALNTANDNAKTVESLAGRY